MDYFRDVYLKQLNKYGLTMQDRVHGKMSHDFAHFLAKSVNKVSLLDKYNEVITQAVTETKKLQDDTIIEYLLTDLNYLLDNGTVVRIKKPFSTEIQNWLIFNKEQYQTIGYNRYQIILLENTIKWIGENNLVYNSLVHYTTNGGRDKAITSQFKISIDTAVYSPNRTLMITMPYNETLTRGIHVNTSKTTWQVSTIDAESIPGIAYITLEEDFSQVGDIANQEKLKGWSFSSTQGESINLRVGTAATVEFYGYFNGTTQDVVVDIEDVEGLTISRIENNKFTFTAAVALNLPIKIKLHDSPEIEQTFDLIATQNGNDWLAIIGPNKLKVSESAILTLNSSLVGAQIDIDSKNQHFTIDSIDGQNITITGKTIGKDSIVITYGDQTFETPINIISMWM